MRRINLLWSLMLLLGFAASAQQMQMPPIPVDTAVRIGKLDNGLTYYVRQNNYPEKRVNFYIAQRVGSLQEEESQRGLAHFLEHMAFNGTKHFNGEGKGVIDYCRSIGVEFGADLNAYTSIDQTVYNINDVPSTRLSAIDSCLLILKDWSDGLLLEDEEIDKERGVIHEEWRLRSSASQRMLERNLETLYPGSKYGRRMPIGTMEVVDNFKYNELRDYYHKWYHPENQAIIVVGDIDPDRTVAKIKELFGPNTTPANAGHVTEEPVPDNEQAIIVVDKDKEQQFELVSAMWKHEAPTNAEKVNMDYLLYVFMRNMACTMLNKRLEEKALEPDCPFLQASVSDGNYLLSSNKDAFDLTVLPKEGKAEDALNAGVIEVLRAQKFGFTGTEYYRAKEEYLSRLEQRYNERNKTRNESLGRAYAANYLEGEPIATIDQTYEIMKQIVPMIPVEAINQLMAEFVKPGEKNLVVLNFNREVEGATYPTPAGLHNAINNAYAADITAYVDNVKDEPLIATMPKPGKIVGRTHSDKFDYDILTLSNGAKVVLKKTDYKADEIMLYGEKKGGKSLYDEKDAANLAAYTFMVGSSGLGNFDNTELEKALAGKQASARLEMGTYYDVISGNSTVKDVETMMQLVYLNMTDIRKDEKTVATTMGVLEQALKNKDQNPESIFNDSVSYITNNRSWRSQPFTVNTLKAIDYDRVLQIAKERTADAGDYTYYIIGNFDEATLLPLIEQYIASLPKGKGNAQYNNVATHPAGNNVVHFKRKMETPKAIARIYWYDMTTPFSVENAVKAEMLGEVLSKVYLQKIREDAGAAYSAGAFGFSQRQGDRPYTGIIGYCPVKPEMSDMALDIMEKEMQAATQTIDAATLADIKEAMIKKYETASKENSHWLNVIEEYNENGIDWQTNYTDIVNAQTPQSVADFAKMLLNARNRAEILMLPE